MCSCKYCCCEHWGMYFSELVFLLFLDVYPGMDLLDHNGSSHLPVQGKNEKYCSYF